MAVMWTCAAGHKTMKNTEAQSRRSLERMIRPVRDQLNVQGQHGNWNCNEYMLGMFNGLECALATLEYREPQYRRKPADGWLDDKIPPGFVPTVADGSNDQAQARRTGGVDCK